MSISLFSAKKGIIYYFLSAPFHFLSTGVSMAENTGSIFHFDSIIFSGGGGGARAMNIIFFGSMFHFPSIRFF